MLQYGKTDFQLRLEDEIRNRTQDPGETMSSFVAALRVLFDKLIPSISTEGQLDRAFRNLHPSYSRVIRRNQFNNFQELLQLGQQEEVRKDREKNYRPPPSPEASLFPNVAYCPLEDLNIRRKPRHLQTPKVAASMADSERNETAAVDNVKFAINNPSKPVSTESQNKDSPRSLTFQSKNRNNNLDSKAPETPSTQTEQATKPSQENTPPVKTFPCWVCKELGHWAFHCPKRTGKICFRCGMKDETTRTCPKYNSNQGNGQGGSK